MEFSCAFCSQPGTIDRFFVCPGHIWRPNMYSVCSARKYIYLKWEDVYPTDDCKPIIRHEDKALNEKQ